MEERAEKIGYVAPGQVPWSTEVSPPLVASPSLRHPTVHRGARVKVCRGLFSGTEGIVETDDSRRLIVLSVQVLQRTVMLEVDPAFVEVIV